MKGWQETVKSSLQQLSSLEAQRLSWIEGVTGLLPSPEEIICQLYDDSGLGDLLDDGAVFSPDCDAALRKLGQAVALVNTNQPTYLLLADPEWHAVVVMAREALREMLDVMGES
jgi:hypothetical protein